MASVQQRLGLKLETRRPSIDEPSRARQRVSRGAGPPRPRYGATGTDRCVARFA